MTEHEVFGNGDWGRHRMHVIEELKRAAIERRDLADEQKRATVAITTEMRAMEYRITAAIADLDKRYEVLKNELSLRASLFGTGSAAIVMLVLVLLQWLVRRGG